MTSEINIGKTQEFIELLRSDLDDLPDPLPMIPLPDPFHAVIKPPGSKSLTNRALVLASLSHGLTILSEPPVGAEDVDVMIDGLRRFGAEIDWVQDEEGVSHLHIRGMAGRPCAAGELHLANAGTAVRFLTAVAALADGPTVIDGSDRMRKRPIGGLVAALRAMHVRVDFLGEYGFPPYCISPPADGSRLPGGSYRLPPQPSSQFISALLMIAPWTREGIEIELSEPPQSSSYIKMTQQLLHSVGAQQCSCSSDMTRLAVASGPCNSFQLEIEPDASGAANFWVAAAISPESRCLISGVGSQCMQGDARFIEPLQRMGASIEMTPGSIAVSASETGELHGIDADLSDMPDTAMALAVAASFAQGRSRLRGVRSLSVKECDRIAATVAELSKFGVRVTSTEDTITIDPPVDGVHDAEPVMFETYNDHRMAMALALVGLRRHYVFIKNPACVVKTYPTYWKDLATLYERSIAAWACPAEPTD